MTVKNYAKIEEKLTCCFRINVRTFDSSTRKSQTFAFQWAAFDQST